MVPKTRRRMIPDGNLTASPDLPQSELLIMRSAGAWPSLDRLVQERRDEDAL